MKRSRHRISKPFIALLAALVLLVPALISGRMAMKSSSPAISARAFEQAISDRSTEVELLIGRMAAGLDSLEWDDFCVSESALLTELFERRDISLFFYRGDSLLLWTDPSLVTGRRLLRVNEAEYQLIKILNGWVLAKAYQAADYRFIALIVLQRTYPYENAFLQNRSELLPSFPSDAGISAEAGKSYLPVTIPGSEHSFWVVPGKAPTIRPVPGLVSAILYLLIFILLLKSMADFLRLGQTLRRSNIWLLALAADLFILRWLMLQFQFPAVWYKLTLFDQLASPLFLFNSTGDSLLTAMLILYYFYQVSQHLRLWPARSAVNLAAQEHGKVRDSWLLIAWGGFFTLFILVEQLIDQLLLRSHKILEIYRVLTIDLYVVTDVAMTLSLHFALFFAMRILVCQLRIHLSRGRILSGFVASAILVFGLSRLAGFGPDLFSIVYLVILAAVITLQPSLKRGVMARGWMTLVLLMITVHTVQHIASTNDLKEKRIQAGMLESLSNEHDDIAEMLLAEMGPRISADTVMRELLFNVVNRYDRAEAEDRVANYLKNNYFDLYWTRYQVNANICDSSNMLRLVNDNLDVPCLRYFTDDVAGRFGQLIEGSGFYFLDNFDGQINYMGIFRVISADSTFGYHLIVHLDSRLITQEMGYPELLIAGQGKRDSLSVPYSYAKYQGGVLTSQSGDYAYSSELSVYPGIIGELRSFEEDGYEHIVYRLDTENAVILSRPETRFIDYLVTFSYIFISLYVIWFIIVFWPLRRGQSKLRDLHLKERIQISMVSVFLLSFILVGGGLVFYNLEQYKKTTRDAIEEKSSMLLTELQHKLDKEPVLQPDWHDENHPGLRDLLVKFSFVFNTDINLYNPQGELIASSRTELFDRNLTSRRMDPAAFFRLQYNREPSVIHEEKIGTLKYYSSYRPFYNLDRQLTAYLNLPYFSRQQEISRDITAFIVALLNIYFLLIFITISITVLLSNQVTRPLREIQEKLARLRLGDVNQEITYHRNDEIGNLVKVYNLMVRELQLSAEKLARSERESAWREMARQIAHEIKNPLTPMKLSVQHLKRVWKGGSDQTKADIDRIADTLVEQIDTLASIASEFSRFAQMPKARYESIDLIERILNVSSLYGEACIVDIREMQGRGSTLQVKIDREQLIQVLNNLIRNAIQAVPDGRKPEVLVSVRQFEPTAVFAVSDNGTGIPREVQEKMFEPNFTTKSSGTGLGLAITRRIIEAAGGRIWFETEAAKGSTFYVELPLYRDEADQ